MLNAFRRNSDGSTVAVPDLDGIRAAAKADSAILWIDLESPTADELQSVGQVLDLDPEALDDCLTGDQRPRIDEFDTYMFILLYGLMGPEPTGAFHPRKLAAFCAARFLVTVHRDPLGIIRTIRERCGRLHNHVLGRGIDFLLYRIIDGMVDNYGIVMDTYENELTGLEETAGSRQPGEPLLRQLSRFSKQFTELRHLATSMREVLNPIVQSEYDYLSPTLELRFSHVRDHLTQVLERIDAQHEILTSLREDYHSALAHRLNRTMNRLTILSTIMLPLSLLAGIYGMNLPLWPPSDAPWSFAAVLATMVLLASAMLIFFRARHWL